jgi:hypothetical protein
MRHPRSQLVSSRILVGAWILVVTLAACASPSSTTALRSLTPTPSDSATGANIPRSPGPQPSETRSSTSTPVNRTPSSSPSPKPGSSSATPAPSNSAPSSGSPAPSTSASSSPRPTRSIRPSPHPTTSPVPTTAELQAALLTPAELPGLGFEAEPAETGSDSGTLLDGCPFATVGQVNPTAQAVEAFTAGSSGPDISEALLQYPVSVAEGQMAQFAETAKVCSSFPASADGLVLKVTIASESFPTFGGDTVALRLSAIVIKANNQTINTDIVAVRHGGTIILITNAGVPLNTALTRTIVAAASAKVPSRW